MSRLLWIAQWILALIFLVAGVAKLVMPLQTVADQIGLPVGLLHFVALMEVLGALGMILPGLLHVRPGLTPLAAAGLIVIMIGAVTVTLRTQPMPVAILPVVTGLLAIFVAYGRWRLVPLN
jgi:uncharacterized membrane protein YphA (DoxX/SURF4 family)